jgi:ABC-2 type transport system ATP-binding protein
VVADERSLFWRLSARENLRLFAALHGLRRGAAEGRVEEMLRVVGLEETGEKMVGAFSSGMRQRLLLARALLARPRVLLLDEPTRGLDPLSARRLRSLLREEVVGRQGCTVLLATHNAEEALELCDRLAILHRGELLAVGAAEELLQRYGDERYRLWVRDDERWNPALLAESEGVRDCRTLPGGEDRWTQVEVVAQGGRERAAALVAGLTAAGVAVAGVERVEIALAELLERIVRTAGGGDA